jgi:uncharacterized membrane protein HdeD (DUF308 family)
MQCNINRRGRKLRAVSGIICCALGAVVCSASVNHFRWTMIWAGIALIAIGIFQLFEARKSWCALRAMGMKTRY